MSPTLVSHTCLPHLSPTLVSHSGFLAPHEFTLVSHSSPTLGALGRMSLHLSPPCLPLVAHLCPTLVSHTCLPLWVPWAAWVYTCLPLVTPLSPTLGALGRMSLHLSPTCLPHLSPTLVSHSGFLGPHEFTLVSPLSPTLGFLGRMSLHLSPPCLPLRVPWAASVYTCLPLVSHICLRNTCLPLWVPWAALSPTLRALGRMSLHLSPPCLPFWVPWAA